MEKIQFEIARIIFQNTENNYCILKGFIDDSLTPTTVVGCFFNAHVDSVFEVEGEWIEDPKWGKQFKAESSLEILPSTIKGLKGYLASGFIKGIGPLNAERIVNHFKQKTLEILEKDPDRLLEVPGIGPKKVEVIKAGWQENQGVRMLIMFLQEHDISPTIATKIYSQYKNNSINVLKDNPYKLCDDIFGIGFLTADGIAEKLGIDKEHPMRLKFGTIYALNKYCEYGNCFMKKNELITESIKLLNLKKNIIENTIESLINSNDIIIKDNENVYPPHIFYAEINVAHKLKILNQVPLKYDIPDDLDLKIARLEIINGFKYDIRQKEAIKEAISSKVMILTGGPGTGKTTIINGIISIFKSMSKTVLLAAPTGKAAKRLSESTNREAKTIHRLLELSPNSSYNRNEENPLTADVLIVDEFSMVDTILINNLLKAVPLKMNVIFVGDTDQLPSIGPGNVLKDIINSNVFNCKKLERIFRQDFESMIIENSYRLNEGKPMNLEYYDDSDFIFLEETKIEKMIENVMSLCENELPYKYKVDVLKDVQVLTPMQKGELGSIILNERLQEALNNETLLVERNGIKYKLNDKVMQIKNNYEKEVFNGDVGTIRSIDLEDQYVIVDIDKRFVKYDFNELTQLQLAYAMTIHKSQGSEYPYVILTLANCHYRMLQRNLLYTAMTRAKKGLFIIGEKKSLFIASQKTDTTIRNTTLLKLLTEKSMFS